MRTELQKIELQRLTFTGTFERYGTKTNYHGYPEKTILLKDIRNGSDRVLCDHIWFSLTKQFDALGTLQPGDRVQFDARVRDYTKGYVNRRKDIYELEIDYKLSHPTKVQKVEIPA